MQFQISKSLFVKFREPKIKQATALLAIFLLTTLYFAPLVSAVPPIQSTLRVDNNFINPTQTSTVTVTASGGTGSYTYVWSTWFGNSPTHTSYPSTSQNTFQFTTTSDTTIGMWQVAVHITDSASNSVDSMPIGIAVVPAGTQRVSGATVTPAISILNPGQQVTLAMSADPSGGIAPYHYQWNKWTGYETPSGTDTRIAGATETSYTFTAPDTYGTYLFQLNSIDSIGLSSGPSQGPAIVFVIPSGSTRITIPLISSSKSNVQPTQTAQLTITTPPIEGTTPYSYQWFQWRDMMPTTLITGATGTSYDFTPDVNTPQGMWHFKVEVTDANGIVVQSPPANVRVVPTGYTPLMPPTISASIFTANLGQQIQFSTTQTPNGGITPYTLQWSKWRPTPGSTHTPIAGATSDSLDFTFNDASDYGSWTFQLNVKDSLNDNVWSNFINIQVLPSDYTPIVGATMTADPNMIHPGGSTTITATAPSDGYGTLTNRWETWVGNDPQTPHQIITGVTGLSYTFSTAPDAPFGLYHFVLVARDQLGMDGWPQNGGAQVMVVPSGYSQLVGVTLQTDQTTINPTQTAHLSTQIGASGGQPLYTYQWMKWRDQDNNGPQAISGATSDTYAFTATDTTPTGTWHFALVVTDSYGIQAWPQQNVDVNVVPAGTPLLIAPTITASALMIHRGDTSTLSIPIPLLLGGQGPYHLQWNKWQWSGPSGPQTISGANSATYTFTPDASVAFGFWNFNLQVTDNLGCEVWSQPVNVLVVPNSYVPLSGAIVHAAEQRVNPSDTIHLTATAPLGGYGTVTYQWMMQQGTGLWTAIPGATHLTLDYITEPTMQYGYWNFVLVATDGFNDQQWPIQGPANVQVVPPSYVNPTGANVQATPYQITPGQTITLSQASAPTGGYGSYHYQWLMSQDNGNTWQPIEGATTATYVYHTSPTMAYGPYSFVLVVTDSVGTEAWPPNGATQVGVVPADYTALTPPILSPEVSAIHPGDSITFTLSTPVLHGQSPYTYQWYVWLSGQVSPSAVGTNSPTFSTTTPNSIPTGTYYVTVQITDAYGFTVTPQNGYVVVVITPAGVQPLSYPSVTADLHQIKAGETATLSITVAPTGGIGTYHYQWYGGRLSGSQQIIPGATSATYQFTADNNDASLGTWLFSLEVRDDANNIVSSFPANVKVYKDTAPVTTPQISVTPTDVRQGEVIHLSSTGVTGGSGNYGYQWVMWQDYGQLKSIPGATTLSYDLATTTSTSPGTWHFLLFVLDGPSGTPIDMVWSENSADVRLTIMISPEMPWGTTIIAFFAAALAFAFVQRRRKRQ